MHALPSLFDDDSASRTSRSRRTMSIQASISAAISAAATAPEIGYITTTLVPTFTRS